MDMFADIRIVHEPMRGIGKGESPADNIIINGKYWGQRHHQSTDFPFTWYVVTSPPALEWDGQGEYVTSQTVLGIYVDESDYDLTIRQLFILTRGTEPPF